MSPDVFPHGLGTYRFSFKSQNINESQPIVVSDTGVSGSLSLRKAFISPPGRICWLSSWKQPVALARDGRSR